MVNRELALLIIDKLNDMAKCDPCAFACLLCIRVPCNQSLADHPTCQVGRSNGGHIVGLIGILNGLAGNYDDGPKKGWGAIAAVFDPASDVGGHEVFSTCKGFTFIENQ
jgi:hypothetical protein